MEDHADPDGAEAEVQCELIDAMRELIEEYGWAFEDVIATLKATRPQ